MFSLVEAPDETIEFLQQLKQLLPSPRFRLRIDLTQVKRIDPEAVASFVAVMESTEGNVIGNVPQDLNCARRLYDFGFFEHVKGGPKLGAPAGTIRLQYSGQMVKGDIARDIIKFGLKQLGISKLKHGPSYTIYTEAMGNTFQHADQNQLGAKKWWARGVL